MNFLQTFRPEKRALPYAQPITFSQASDARSQATVHHLRTTITKDHTQRPAGSRSNRLVRKTLLKMHPPVPLPAVPNGGVTMVGQWL
ncbi:hypothetical protein L210DRAFT_3585319, partial [Boletus edulis BED1]